MLLFDIITINLMIFIDNRMTVCYNEYRKAV